MIISMELSKSSISICKFCRNKISKGVPRLINNYGSFICYKCAVKYIDKEINMLNESKKKWEEYLKVHSKIIVINELK